MNRATKLKYILTGAALVAILFLASAATVWTGYRVVTDISTNYVSMIRYDRGTSGVIVAIHQTNFLNGLKTLPNWPVSTGEVSTAQLNTASNHITTNLQGNIITTSNALQASIDLKASTANLNTASNHITTNLVGRITVTSNALQSAQDVFSVRVDDLEAFQGDAITDIANLQGATNGLQNTKQPASAALTNLATAGTTGSGAVVLSNAPTISDAVFLGTSTFNNLDVSKLSVSNNFFASAAAVTLDATNSSRFTLTNSLAHNMTITLTNLSEGDEVLIEGPAADSGGTDYTLTFNDTLATVWRWFSTTNGSPAFTATNGMRWEVSLRKPRQHETNVVTAVHGLTKP